MEQFVVAIPSYQRAGKQSTAEYMHKIGLPKDSVYIFVQTEQDYEAYKKHEEIANVVYASADSVPKARNNILRHFDCNILMMDDDVRRISIMRKKLEPINSREQFANIFNKCFAHTAKNGSGVFGIYPVYNEFFMSPTISTKVTVNTVVGFTKGFKLMFDERYTAKEDIELCARILHNGGRVCRHNYLAVDAKHRTNSGGCYEAWHSDENKKAVKRLCMSYPEILAPQSKNEKEVRVIIKDKKIQLAGTKGEKREN